MQRMIVGVMLPPGLSFERTFALDWDGLNMIQNHGFREGLMASPEASMTCNSWYVEDWGWWVFSLG